MAAKMCCKGCAGRKPYKAHNTDRPTIRWTYVYTAATVLCAHVHMDFGYGFCERAYRSNVDVVVFEACNPLVADFRAEPHFDCDEAVKFVKFTKLVCNLKVLRQRRHLSLLRVTQADAST